MSSQHPPTNAVPVSARQHNDYLKRVLLLAAGIFLISFPELELQDILGTITNFTLR